MKEKTFVTMKDFTKKYGIKFCVNHTGKMQGMISLSTSVLLNTYCQTHCKVDNSICQHCYAARMNKMYKGLENVTAANTKALTENIIPVNAWPMINACYIRLEAFGDLNNVTQVINYFNFCKANKQAKIALWTKNPNLIDQAIKAGHKKPNNLVIIVSSLFLNTISNYNYDFIDKVFTVYDKGHAKQVNINCGARNCLTCNRCYHRTKNIEYINELLK